MRLLINGGGAHSAVVVSRVHDCFRWENEQTVPNAAKQSLSISFLKIRATTSSDKQGIASEDTAGMSMMRLKMVRHASLSMTRGSDGSEMISRAQRNCVSMMKSYISRGVGGSANDGLGGRDSFLYESCGRNMVSVYVSAKDVFEIEVMLRDEFEISFNLSVDRINQKAIASVQVSEEIGIGA